MPKNEDGEFELILGNKQLLSMFFVVAMLLGVFFVMGYIVGRNSAPLTAETPHKPEPAPLVVDSPAPKAAPPEAAPAPNPAPITTAAQQPDKPAEKAPEPVKAAPPPVAKAEPPKETPKPEPKREAKVVEKADPNKATKAKPAVQSASAAPKGTYLQLAAVDKQGADKEVEVLRKNGFQAIDAEVADKPGLFRVLVGPVNPGDFNKVKVDLQSKGFEGNRAFKQTF